MKVVVVERPGGPDQMQLLDWPKPTPGPGQALVKIAAAGVNFIDIYHRTGLYKVDPPITLGMEAAGVVEATGDGVSEVAPGDRVAYAMSRGAYAEYAVVPAWMLVKLPPALDFESAAAAMLQGMTAHYLVFSTYPLKEGEACVVHAAAGGVGLLLVQMAKMRGARVFATVSTEAKAELARQAGADEVILYTKQDFLDVVRAATNGRGVDVVYDSVGTATWEKSLDCLRPRGMMVSYGNSSGPVPPFQPLVLSQKGSLYLTRPSLQHYVATREELLWRAGDVLGGVQDGRLKLRIERVYKLSEAGEAHRALESRATAGKLLLVPG